jgi:hypothetical protein
MSERERFIDILVNWVCECDRLWSAINVNLFGTEKQPEAKKRSY